MCQERAHDSIRGCLVFDILHLYVDKPVRSKPKTHKARNHIQLSETPVMKSTLPPDFPKKVYSVPQVEKKNNFRTRSFCWPGCFSSSSYRAAKTSTFTSQVLFCLSAEKRASIQKLGLPVKIPLNTKLAAWVAKQVGASEWVLKSDRTWN